MVRGRSVSTRDRNGEAIMAMIQEGHYRAKLENPEIRVSTKQGTPCIAATVVILEEGPHKGTRIPWEGWLTASAAARTIKSMAFAGCTFPPEPGSDEPNLEDFTGCGTIEVDAQVELEEYTPEATDEQKAKNEKPKTSHMPRVAFINPIGASRASQKVDKSQQKMIAKSWAGPAKAALAELKSGKSTSGIGGDTSFDTKAMDAQAAPAGTPKKLY